MHSGLLGTSIAIDGEETAALIPLRDDVGRRGFTILTWSLVTIWVAIYLVTLDATREEYHTFHHHFGLDASAWRVRLDAVRGAPGIKKVWHIGALLVPLFSYKLLHGGPVQLVSNAFALLVFGGRLEARGGFWRFLFFEELVGLAVAAVTLTTGGTSGLWIGGSGIVAGIVVAYLALHLRSRIRVMFPVVVWPVFFQLPAVVVALAWVGLQWPRISGLLHFDDCSPIGWQGLASGAVSGVALLPVLLVGRAPKSRSRR